MVNKQIKREGYLNPSPASAYGDDKEAHSFYQKGDQMPKHVLLNRIDEEIYEKLRALAFEEKTSINQLVAEFIAEGLERRGI